MKRITISDHALLRYIERVHGVDLTQLRDIIAGTIGSAAQAGATSYSKGGFTYAISQRNGEAMLTTVLPEESPQAAVRGGFRAVGRHHRSR